MNRVCSPCVESSPFWGCQQTWITKKRFALRMCSKSWEANYHDLLDHYQTPELSAHRQYISLSHLKIMQLEGLCVSPKAPISRYSNAYSTQSQEANNLTQQYAQTDVLYHSFFPWTISQWNYLQQSPLAPHCYHSYWYRVTDACNYYRNKI